MKIEVGQTYECNTRRKWQIVHKADLKSESHPYLGVELQSGDCVNFNESGANRSSWIQLIQLIIPPKEPKLKPFTRETFPVDAWLRKRDATEFNRVVLISDSDVGIISPAAQRYYSWSELLAYFEYSVDGCKTWHPCGVKE